MNRGLVKIIVHLDTRATVDAGWLSRSAVHRRLKELAKGGTIDRPSFFLAYDASGNIIGVGKPTGAGWTSTING